MSSGMRGVAATLVLAAVLTAGAFWQWGPKEDTGGQPEVGPVMSDKAVVPAPIAGVTQGASAGKPNPVAARNTPATRRATPVESRQSSTSIETPQPPAPPAAVSAPIPSAVTVVPSVSPAPAGVVPTLLDPPPVQTASRSKSSTELTIKKDAVIGISIDSSVSSHTAKVDDKINARVSRDVMVDGRVAIPANARLEGMVTLVERAGSTGGRDRIGVRFTTLVLPDKTRMPIQTETIFRGPEAGEVSLARSPNPVQGARGTAGAARNSAFNTNPGVPALAPGARSDAFIPGGSQLTVKLTAPLFVIIGRED